VFLQVWTSGATSLSNRANNLTLFDRLTLFDQMATLGLGFIYQLFNSDNLALNDKFSNTRLTKN
jgi:hypothetical protein